MKVGIIGYGFVGKALQSSFKKNVSVCKVDPVLDTNIDDLISFSPEIIFICVPTPMNEDGSQDLKILLKYIPYLNNNFEDCIIVIKSTVLPKHLELLKTKIKRLVYNPEFLREKHAEDDFINSPMIVFGGDEKDNLFLENFYKNYTNCICQEYINTDIITASFIKYTINSFLATKVVFFNELNSLFIKSNAKDNWANFINALLKDKRMGVSHMDVPGHDGKKGFGGACFPKDTIAFYNFSLINDSSLSVLKQAIDVNNKIRQEYNTSQREQDQNINFKNKDDK